MHQTPYFKPSMTQREPNCLFENELCKLILTEIYNNIGRTSNPGSPLHQCKLEHPKFSYLKWGPPSFKKG